jgi:RimJ/RimL family protein N-acetyltransferase
VRLFVSILPQQSFAKTSLGIIAPRVLLVPYSAHHVPTYHEWMQDEEIQKATASEPLTLEEEYSMQRSWRTDNDKLTFIVCTHDSTASQIQPITAGKQDAPQHMVGDVNLFLYDDEDDEDPEQAQDEKSRKRVIGELEIMIASPSHRGRGLAHETLRAFMSYMQSHLDSILSEFSGESGGELRYLRVKIDKDNARSLALFERLGFVRTRMEANYFGEVELRTPFIGGKLRDVSAKIGLEGFGRTVGYETQGSMRA